MQVVDLGFQSEVPGDLLLAPQSVRQAYLILNGSRYRMPCVVSRAKLGV